MNFKGRMGSFFGVPRTAKCPPATAFKELSFGPLLLFSQRFVVQRVVLRTSFVILSKIRKDRHVNMYPTSPRAQGCPSDPFRYFLTDLQGYTRKRVSHVQQSADPPPRSKSCPSDLLCYSLKDS